MRRRRAERTRGVALAQGWVPAFFVANFFSSSWLGPSNQSSLLTGRDLGTPKNFGPLPPVDRARPDASNLINFLQVKLFFSFIWPQRKNPGGRSVLRWMQTCGGLKISDPTKPINLFLAKSAGTQHIGWRGMAYKRLLGGILLAPPAPATRRAHARRGN